MPAPVTISPVRSVPISRAYFDRFGGAPGCKKCIAITIGDESQPSLGHDPACRKRFEGLMAEDPILSKKLDRAEKRREEFQEKSERR